MTVTMTHNTEEGRRDVLVWFGMPCGLEAARRQPLTFPVKGSGSGQQPASTRGRLVHPRGWGGWQLCVPPLSHPSPFPWCSCPLC